MKQKFNDIITEHFLNKRFVRITREKGDFKETSNGISLVMLQNLFYCKNVVISN